MQLRPKHLSIHVLQGVMGRVASWFGGSSSSRNGSADSRSQHHGSSSSSSGVPDFLSQADDPDKRRVDQSRSQGRGVYECIMPLTTLSQDRQLQVTSEALRKHADARLHVFPRSFDCEPGTAVAGGSRAEHSTL